MATGRQTRTWETRMFLVLPANLFSVEARRCIMGDVVLTSLTAICGTVSFIYGLWWESFYISLHLFIGKKYTETTHSIKII